MGPSDLLKPDPKADPCNRSPVECIELSDGTMFLYNDESPDDQWLQAKLHLPLDDCL